MSVQLRPYQRTLLEGISAEFRRGHRSVLGQLPTGGGKTEIAMEAARLAVARGKRVLFQAHTRVLVDQTSARFAAAGLEHGVIMAGREERDHPLQIGSIMTLVRRLDRVEPFNLIVTDECFPVGTLVDGRPIETIRAGQEVRSFDDATGRVVGRGVVRTFKRKTSRIVRVTLDNGVIMVCTDNHPVRTPGGWLRAQALAEGCLVNVDPVHRVREPDAVSVEGDVGRMADARQGLLLGPVPGHGLGEVQGGDDGRDQPAPRFQADERTQPDAVRGEPRKDAGDLAAHRAQAEQARRERARAAIAAADVGAGAGRGVDAGSGHPDPTRAAERIPELLQGGHRPRGAEGGDRGGRRQPLRPGASGEGSKEDGILAIARVVRAEVHERGSSDQFERLCPGGDVYNIEVEGTHTYFAEGVAVHNCHRATSESYSTILAAWPGSYHIGLSATPARSDGRGLGGVYEALVCGPSVAELVELGYLAKFRVFAPSVPDLSNVKTKGGDWEEAGLAAAMDKPVITGCAITHYQRLAAGRQAIAYCCTIAHAESVTRQFKEAGLDAEVLHSKLPPEQQEAVVGRVRAGNLAVLVAIGMVSEGFDVPNVTCAILLRPTKSLVLACQQWGRANRGVAAPDALVLDHASNTSRFGLPTSPRDWTLEDKKKKPAERSLVKTCKSCFATVLINCSTCPECGEPFPLAQAKPPPRTKSGELVEIRSWLHVDRSRAGIAAAIAQCRDWRELKALGRHMGYAKGWPYHAARERGWRPVVNGAGYCVGFMPPRPAGE